MMNRECGRLLVMPYLSVLNGKCSFYIRLDGMREIDLFLWRLSVALTLKESICHNFPDKPTPV
jgi:hypothetical protein